MSCSGGNSCWRVRVARVLLDRSVRAAMRPCLGPCMAASRAEQSPHADDGIRVAGALLVAGPGRRG